ncbi:response regulator [Stenotrophomonas rhizophila]
MRWPTSEAAGDRLQRAVYDGLLLDLNLGGEDGFELLRRAVAGRYHCVVVSAHRERALQAFEHGVLDFVPKPFSRERTGPRAGAPARRQPRARRQRPLPRHLAGTGHCRGRTGRRAVDPCRRRL